MGSIKLVFQGKNASGRSLLAAVAGVSLTTIVASNARAVVYTYTITNLGAGSGLTDTESSSINAGGNALVNSDDPNINPKLFTGGNNYQPLNGYASHGDFLKQINNAGAAVGTGTNAAGASQAVFEDTSVANPTPIALNSLGGATDAFGVNPTGAASTIVGDSVNGGGFLQAVRWTGTFSSGGTVSAITPTNAGWGTGSQLGSSAHGINTSGTIIGQALTSAGQPDAFKTVGTTFVDITPTGGVNSLAESINTAGTIVGNSVDGNGDQYGFIYNPTTGVSSLLPTLGGPTVSSDAESINTAGLSVGQADAADDSNEHAVLYSTDGSIVDLNSDIDPSLGWVLTNAESINDSGSIVGVGLFNGAQDAFLLTPAAAVPEPVSLVILLAPTVLLRRRR